MWNEGLERAVHFFHNESRVVFIITLIMVHVSAWFGSRKLFIVHGILMTAATTSITILFLAGVIVRGLMGSVGKVAHGPIFYAALILHILSGALFLLMATLILFPSGMRKLVNPARSLSDRHPSFGAWAVRSLTISVLCLVVM